MLINELPDDCLIAVFSLMSRLDDLINCFKVCSKWRCLVTERTKKVKYLIRNPSFIFCKQSYRFDCVYYGLGEPIHGSFLRTLFPNLIVADLSRHLCGRVMFEDLVELVRNHESLKGVIPSRNRHDPITEYCDKLEMIATDHITPSMKQNGSSMKQLSLRHFCPGYSLKDFKEDAHCFPNLERLSIFEEDTCRCPLSMPDHYYNGPVFEKLKIVELNVSSCYGVENYSLKFMDSCPNLQSAFIVLKSRHLFVDESVKHQCLQDLVFHFHNLNGIDWNVLKRLVMKFPNLKHLGLSVWNLKIKHIEQLVHILPNLVLLDARGCVGLTQRAADYIQEYCKRYGRSIKFYTMDNDHEIEKDWPQSSTKPEIISRGFDFMKHCFFKDFGELSPFLIPIDDGKTKATNLVPSS